MTSGPIHENIGMQKGFVRFGQGSKKKRYIFNVFASIDWNLQLLASRAEVLQGTNHKRCKFTFQHCRQKLYFIVLCVCSVPSSKSASLIFIVGADADIGGHT